jgi:hypothetical protein
VKESENGRLFDLETEKIDGARLVGASVTKTATLLGVSRATISKFMSSYTIMGRQYQRRGTVGKNQH